jgi:hypothetical protein
VAGYTPPYRTVRDSFNITVKSGDIEKLTRGKMRRKKEERVKVSVS